MSPLDLLTALVEAVVVRQLLGGERKAWWMRSDMRIDRLYATPEGQLFLEWSQV